MSNDDSKIKDAVYQEFYNKDMFSKEHAHNLSIISDKVLDQEYNLPPMDITQAGYNIGKRFNIEEWIKMNANALGDNFEQVFQDIKKDVEGVLTKFVTTQMMGESNQQRYFRHIMLTSRIFKEALSKFIPRYNNKFNKSYPADVAFIVYKGSNLVRLMYSDLDLYYTQQNNKAFEKFKEAMSPVLVRSDNDYSIYINKNIIKKKKDFDHIEHNITILSYYLLDYIRVILTNNLPYYFEFYANSQEEQKESLRQNLLQKLVDPNFINETKFVKKNGDFVAVALGDIMVTSDRFVDKGDLSSLKLSKVLIEGTSKNDILIRLHPDNDQYVIVQHLVPLHKLENNQDQRDLFTYSQNSEARQIEHQPHSVYENSREYNDKNNAIVSEYISLISKDMSNELKQLHVTCGDNDAAPKVAQYRQIIENGVSSLIKTTREYYNNTGIRERGTPFYITVNDTVDFGKIDLRYPQRTRITSFSLVRMKVNFSVSYFDDNVQESSGQRADIGKLQTKTYKFGGELIDISILKFEDYELTHTYQDEDDPDDSFSVIEITDGIISEKVTIYSDMYVFYDIDKMLFIQSIKPWLASKFEARFKRLFIVLLFILTKYLIQNNNNRERTIDVLQLLSLIISIYENIYERLQKMNQENHVKVLNNIYANLSKIYETSIKNKYKIQDSKRGKTIVDAMFNMIYSFLIEIGTDSNPKIVNFVGAISFNLQLIYDVINEKLIPQDKPINSQVQFVEFGDDVEGMYKNSTYLINTSRKRNLLQKLV